MREITILETSAGDAHLSGVCAHHMPLIPERPTRLDGSKKAMRLGWRRPRARSTDALLDKANTLTRLTVYPQERVPPTIDSAAWL